MTHLTSSVIARLHLDITDFFNDSQPTTGTISDEGSIAEPVTQTPRRSSSRTVSTSPNILDRLKSLYDQPTPIIPALTYSLWHTLLSAIRERDLTLAILSDRPSELADGRLWLSHERVTALLAEQELDHADIPPILFHLIMSATEHLYPSAVIAEHNIDSEYSFDSTGRPERRYGFCILLDRLPIPDIQCGFCIN